MKTSTSTSTEQKKISAALDNMVATKTPNKPKTSPLETTLAPHRDEIRNALKKGFDWDMIATELSEVLKRDISPSTLRRIIGIRVKKNKALAITAPQKPLLPPVVSLPNLI